MHTLVLIFPRPSIHAALRAVAVVSGLPVEDLVNPPHSGRTVRKTCRDVEARTIACLLLTRGLGLSQPEAARALSLGSHTSVTRACQVGPKNTFIARCALVAGRIARAEAVADLKTSFPDQAATPISTP